MIERIMQAMLTSNRAFLLYYAVACLFVGCLSLVVLAVAP